VQQGCFDLAVLHQSLLSAPSWRTVMAQITEKANYGEQATGKFLEDQFSKPPFGWDFEAVRLLAPDRPCDVRRLAEGRCVGGDNAFDS